MKTQIFNTFAEIVITKDEVNVPKGTLSEQNLSNALQLMFGFAGSIALIIIVIAGLQYVLSQGNPQSAAKAKDTIIYALVGLAVCIFAFAIVRFVVLKVS